jgi:acyl-CoA synthetase (AMP-forming)/AMP-acid ligase II
MTDLFPTEFFDRGVALAPDRLCLEYHDTHYTYGAAQAATWRVANALRARGVPAGAHIGVYSPNNATGFLAILSILRLGGVWVNLNCLNSVEETFRYLKKTEAQVLFLHSRFFPMLDDFCQACPEIRCFIGIDGQAPGLDCSFEELLEEGEATPPPPPDADPDRLASLFPTGGTTGDPKAVMFTNRMWTRMIKTYCATLSSRKPPVYLMIAPMTHGGGGIAMALMPLGASHIIMDGFDIDQVLSVIESRGVTHLFLPPTAIYQMLAHPGVRRRDYSSLEVIHTGSAPVPADRLREAVDVFGPVLAQTYGQSEAPLICTCFTPQEIARAIKDCPQRLKSCGRPTEGVEIGIMDSTGAILPTGERGEIVVKSDLVTPGYYHNPEATAQLQKNGWHRTGDVGYRDEDGFVYIVDRIKEMIISGGFNIFPAEIENAIMSHDAVQECAVVGVPDEKWGEAVKAVVTLRPGHSASEQDIIAHCKNLLGSVRTPKTVEFWDALPKSAVGKVLRREVRATFWRQADRAI